MDARTDREKRLTDALRQNLLRRKAQARDAKPARLLPETDGETTNETDGETADETGDER